MWWILIVLLCTCRAKLPYTTNWHRVTAHQMLRLLVIILLIGLLKIALWNRYLDPTFTLRLELSRVVVVASLCYWDWYDLASNFPWNYIHCLASCLFSKCWQRMRGMNFQICRMSVFPSAELRDLKKRRLAVPASVLVQLNFSFTEADVPRRITTNGGCDGTWMTVTGWLCREWTADETDW